MKKILSVLLALVMLFGVSACAENAPLFATMADALDESVSVGVMGWLGDSYVAIAEVDGKYIRVVALVDEEASRKVEELYQSDDYETAWQQMDELAASLPVAYSEDISEGILNQEALDALVGMTLGELKEAGWEIASYGYGEEVDFTLRCGLFYYNFVVDASIELFEQRNEAEDFDDFTVKSVRFESVAGAALDLHYQADGTYVPDESEDDASFDAFMSFFGEFLAAAESGDEADLEAAIQSLMEAYPEEAESIQMILNMMLGTQTEEAAE